MRIGINTGFFIDIWDDITSIKKLAELGFDAVDYSYYLYAVRGSIYETGDWREHLKNVRQTADSLGIVINQMHAPLLKYVGEEVDEDFKAEMTLRAFETCEVLGCSYLVIHPRKFRNYNTPEEKECCRQYNLDMYRSYIPLAHRYGVTIAIENMFRYNLQTNKPMDTVFQGAEEMNLFLDRLPEEHFTACLDTGHANINEIQPHQMLMSLGRRAKVLHIHDNMRIADSHFPPSCGNVEWKPFLDALRQFDFDGVFSFELMPRTTFALPELAAYIRHMGQEMTD